MKKSLIIILSVLFCAGLSAQQRKIASGADNGELYMATFWWGKYYPFPPYYDTLRTAVYRLTENGKKLTIKYETCFFTTNIEIDVLPGLLLADATQGVLYNYGTYYKNNLPHTRLWVSFDYGKNWIFREENLGNKSYFSSNTNQLLYRTSIDGTYHSFDYGISFDIVKNGAISAMEPGFEECEFFSLIGRGFYHTYDCFDNYNNITIGSEFVFGYVPGVGISPDVYRGALHGEVYISSWFPGYDPTYKVSFSDDFGENFRVVYECNENCYNPIEELYTSFMSDREPGVFYIIKKKQIPTTIPWGWYVQICVEHYRDYGDSLVGIYCHDLTKDYCEPVHNLTAEQYIGNSVMLNWEVDSRLEAEGFEIYRKNLLPDPSEVRRLPPSPSEGEGDLTLFEMVGFCFDPFYLDENLEAGYYEYYVVAHYTNGCISDISDIVNVNIDEMYEVTFEVKDIENIPIPEATIAINDKELTTNEQGIAVVFLINDVYSYNVSSMGYIETGSNFTVASEPQTIIVTMEKESYQITFEVKDINTLPIFEALISINNEVLLTDNLGIAAVFLFDGEYFYTVSKEGYFDIDSVLTVSGAPQTVFLEMEDWSNIEELRITNYELRVYPNPTTGELFVEIAGDPESSSGRRSAQPLGSAKNDIKSIEMFDVFGRNVGVQFSPSFGGGRGEVSHLSAGFYFVRITTKNGIVIKKVVKQ